MKPISWRQKLLLLRQLGEVEVFLNTRKPDEYIASIDVELSDGAILRSVCERGAGAASAINSLWFALTRDAAKRGLHIRTRTGRRVKWSPSAQDWRPL